MSDTAIIGAGRLGRAVATALRERGAEPVLLGRPDGPAGARHAAGRFAGAGLAIEASIGTAVVGNVSAALEGGVRRFVIATTGWDADRPTVEALLREYGAAAVMAPNFSLGTVLFARLVDHATDLFGRVTAFDPYLVEWHRRGKADRPSGTAAALAERIVARHPRLTSAALPGADGPTAGTLEVASIRAGSSPGMHLVGFDAPGETVELRITARDRAGYAAGIVAAADWLRAGTRTAGIHSFDAVVDDLLAIPTLLPA